MWKHDWLERHRVKLGGPSDEVARLDLDHGDGLGDCNASGNGERTECCPKASNDDCLQE
jgi:hypothetical protein